MMFISKTSNNLNGLPLDTDNISDNICLSVKYPTANVNAKTKILLDSGAFQERYTRITNEQAYQRQKEHCLKLGITPFYLAAYDKIGCVEETIKANTYLINNIDINSHPIVIIQGNNIAEMEKCYFNLPTLNSNHCIGFGGIAKISRNNDIKERLYAFIKKYFNNINKKDVYRIHFFGVGSFPVIKSIYEYAKDYEFYLSFDTATVEIRSVMGSVFNNGVWTKTYSKEDKMFNYHPNTLFHQNLKEYVNYYNKIAEVN